MFMLNLSHHAGKKYYYFNHILDCYQKKNNCCKITNNIEILVLFQVHIGRECNFAKHAFVYR